MDECKPLELGTMRRILHTIPKHPRLVNVIDVSPPHAPKQCVIPTGRGLHSFTF